MSTTAPENSVQTIGRLAWTGAKVAYGAAVANHIFSPCIRRPSHMDDELEVDGYIAENHHEEAVARASDLRQYIDDALNLKPGDKYYAESADDICAALKILIVAPGWPAWGSPLDPSKRAELWKIHGWAAEMLKVWKKIRLVRLKQQQVIQDEYLVKMGAKSRFSVLEEAAFFQYDRAFKYFLRFLIFGAIFMMIWLAIDPSSARAFDDSLPRYNSGSWVLGILRWFGVKVD
jgi:hypothetical protein